MSVLRNKRYVYEYVGIIVTLYILVNYFVKGVISTPFSEDKGEIIPHVLSTKCTGLAFSPSYG